MYPTLLAKHPWCLREEQTSQNVALIVTVSHEGAELASKPKGKCHGCFSAAGGKEQSQSNRTDKSLNSDRDDWEELDKDQ